MACYAIENEVTMVVVPFIPLGRNSLDCPLYVRSQDVITIPAANLITDVSFIHHCGGGCKFNGGGRKRNVEREAVVTEECLSFNHDNNNQVYCYNVFCLNN